jgi:16S rRNA G527 N7-methylase RsmG
VGGSTRRSRHEAEIADLGAGAGFPGLPLAIALPGSRLWLVESNERKCQFLQRAVAECELDNVEVVRERVELWRAGHGVWRTRRAVSETTAREPRRVAADIPK